MRKPAIVAALILMSLLVIVAALLGLKVQHQLGNTRSQVMSENVIPFKLGPLAKVQNIGFEPLAALSTYREGAIFQGSFYLAAPGGLAEYTSLDGQPHVFRTGTELPPAPIVRMAVGMLRGDSRPQLLLATEGAGVLSYDGSSFRQLLPRAKAASDVTALLPLASGDLLIGTRQMGLLFFNGRELAQFHPDLTGFYVTALAGDEGDFWVGTRNGGVFHWHAGEIEHFDGSVNNEPPGLSFSLPDPQVEAICLAPGRAYVGTPEGVEEFDSTSGNARPIRTLASGVFAHALAVDATTLTIATLDMGIREIPLAAKHSARPEAAESLQAEDFFRDNTNAFSGTHSLSVSLFAVGKSGVFRRGPSGDWLRVLDQTPVALTDRNVAALSFAPDGRLWIGYFDRGLDIIGVLDRPGEQANVAEHIEDDHVFCVNRIIADPNRNTMDVATANGLALFDTDGREHQVLQRRDGLIADQVTDVLISREATTVATPAGITFIDATGTQSIYAFHGLVNNHVYALASDPSRPEKNLLLAGTLGGVSLLEAKTVRRNLTTANSGLKHNWITAIVPVDDGWFVGTYGAGVMHLDADGHINAADGASGPIEINPNAMLVTAQHIFAGSLGRGLFMCNRSTDRIDRWLRISAGLPSLNVTALAEHDGYIYIGTDNGIVRIAERLLEQERMPL
jgi:ligand-binding sensor domain-containing protein